MTQLVDFSKFSSVRVGGVHEVAVLESVEDALKQGFAGRVMIGGANNLLVSPNPPPMMMLGGAFDYISLSGDVLSIGAATKSGKIYNFAKKQGIVSCQLMLATVAISFFAKLYLVFTRPHGESQEQLIKLLEGSVNFVLFLAATVYMWHALKKLEEIYDADALNIYKQMIFASIVFAVVGIAFGFIRGIEDRPATAGTGLAGLFILAITVYLTVLWAKLNFSLAKITENDLFKTYVFFAIASFIIAFALQIMLSIGYFTAVFSILLAALAIAILYVLPTAFYLYAWTMIKGE